MMKTNVETSDAIKADPTVASLVNSLGIMRGLIQNAKSKQEKNG